MWELAPRLEAGQAGKRGMGKCLVAEFSPSRLASVSSSPRLPRSCHLLVPLPELKVPSPPSICFPTPAHANPTVLSWVAWLGSSKHSTSLASQNCSSMTLGSHLSSYPGPPAAVCPGELLHARALTPIHLEAPSPVQTSRPSAPGLLTSAKPETHCGQGTCPVPCSVPALSPPVHRQVLFR